MNKKQMIIAGIIFSIIIISLAVYLVLNTTTDIFKPTNEIFYKYLKENINKINEIVDISKEQDYIQTLKQNNYRDETEISIKYKNTQGDIEKFKILSQGITNNSEDNSYRSISIKYDENFNVMNLEYLKEKQKQGLLFSDIVNQFITTDIEDIEEFLNIIGISIKDINKEEIIKYYDIFINERDDIEKSCVSFISKMNNSKFSKQKNVEITLNSGEKKSTNAYHLQLSSEDTKELYLEILNTLNMQEKINEINTNRVLFPKTEIVIYISNNNTICMSITTDNIELKIDFHEEEIHVVYNNLKENEIKNIDINIKKEDKAKVINYNDSNNNKLNVNYSIEDNLSNKNANVVLDFQNDFIYKIDLELNQRIKISKGYIEEINKKFENQKYITLEKLGINDRNSALNSLLKRIDALLLNVNNQIDSRVIYMWIRANEILEDKCNGINEKHIKEFNNQFLPYRGQDIEKKIIYNLLDLCGRNMEKYDEVQENIFRIYISQDTTNNNLSEEIKEKIDKSDLSFNVEFRYNSDGKINIVEIKSYEKQ